MHFFDPVPRSTLIEIAVGSATDAGVVGRGIVLGYRFHVGPLKLTDMVGLDVRLGLDPLEKRRMSNMNGPPRLECSWEG
jgi:3-hydroxybutyryl-CoA dehydrogenase